MTDDPSCYGFVLGTGYWRESLVSSPVLWFIPSLFEQPAWKILFIVCATTTHLLSILGGVQVLRRKKSGLRFLLIGLFLSVASLYFYNVSLTGMSTSVQILWCVGFATVGYIALLQKKGYFS